MAFNSCTVHIYIYALLLVSNKNVRQWSCFGTQNVLILGHCKRTLCYSAYRVVNLILWWARGCDSLQLFSIQHCICQLVPSVTVEGILSLAFGTCINISSVIAFHLVYIKEISCFVTSKRTEYLQCNIC